MFTDQRLLAIAALALTAFVFQAATGSNAINAPARTASIATNSDDVVRQSDFDGDGTVGFSDLLAFAGVFGSSKAV